MKLLKTENPISKTVNYFGIELNIPANHYYIAADEDGEVYSYGEKPKPFDNYFRPENFYSEDDYRTIATVDLCGMNWADSLIELNRD
jgi:hypothetical protein